MYTYVCMYACPIVASVQLSPHPTPPRSLRATSRVEMSGTDCRSTHRSCSSNCHPYRLVLTVPPPPAPSAHLPSHTVPCTPLHTLTTPLHYTQLTHPMSRFRTDLIPHAQPLLDLWYAIATLQSCWLRHWCATHIGGLTMEHVMK